jgi:putative DNA methylase
MAANIKAPKKLIEVALPLDAINKEAAREKSIRHGHPSTLHLWWARRPLAAARAVLFAQMVNDPGGERGYYAGKTKKQADHEREQLFDIIRDLVKWENTNNEAVLERAREAIRQSWRETCELNKGKPGFDPDKLPAFHDPFAGGGSIPLEAQRLGLESYASDLNPVAVLINKAMIEIPPRFAGRAPVGPIPDSEKQHRFHEDWSGAKGLAEDVRRYGHWMREEAFKRIGHLYPKVEITAEMAKGRPDLKGLVGQKLTVIAWLWARTVKSPNPAFSHVDVPLASTFILSSKAGKEVWVEPIIDGDAYHFAIRMGKPPETAKEGTKLARGANFRCLLSGSPIGPKYIYSEANAGRMGTRLMAIVAEGACGRTYLVPTADMENIAYQAQPGWRPEAAMPDNPRWFSPPLYGLKTYGDLFTSRQLVALTTFSDLVAEAREKVREDASKAGMPDDRIGLETGGTGATAYAEAVAVYLAFGVDKMSDRHSTLGRWDPTPTASGIINTFSRQALPMTWDYAEGNPFSEASGNFEGGIGWIAKAITTSLPASIGGAVSIADASAQRLSMGKIVSTDPPYYDNIGYADLSDFFYVWLRRPLRPIFPGLFATLAVPKSEELVATPYRHGSKEAAEQFFLDGMTKAMHRLSEQAHPAFPTTIYYAFKQSDTTDVGTGNTGWETFLDAVLTAGFAITGTWPMRTELGNRMIGSGTNALASSIVLVCRKREIQATSISRRDFQRELREVMPEALETMIGGTEGTSPIAPVDLAQAAIGPGMAVFSKYKAVLNQDGSPMSVHDALILINREITDFLNPDSGSYDNDTLFCASWFDQYGWGSGPFGEADTLSRAKGTNVDGVKQAGVIESGGGKVRLLKWEEYPPNWNPKTDSRMPVWEATHQTIRALNQKGESEAGALLARMPEHAETIRQLAYHLYTLCERKKWAEEARAYNELITSWHSIVSASHEVGLRGTQEELFA